mgnify:CR=1 FL=1
MGMAPYLDREIGVLDRRLVTHVDSGRTDRFADEIERCSKLGIPGLVMHPGSHLGEGEGSGLAKVCSAFKEIFAEIDPVPLGSASIAQIHWARLASADERHRSAFAEAGGRNGRREQQEEQGTRNPFNPS